MKLVTSMGTVHIRKGAKVGFVEEDACGTTSHAFVKCLESLAQEGRQKNPNLEYVGFQVSKVADTRLLVRIWQVEPKAYEIVPFKEDTRPEPVIEVSVPRPLPAGGLNLKEDEKTSPPPLVKITGTDDIQ